MPTANENRQPANSSSLRGIVARHPVAAFLVMAYAFAWTIQLAAFRFGLPLAFGSSIGAIFRLALPAFLVTAATSGKAGVRYLLSKCLC